MVELPGRLVEPGAPGRAPVQGDLSALIAGQDPAGRVRRIDPQMVEVVTGGVALDRHEGRAAIVRAQNDGVADPYLVGVSRVDCQLTEIPSTLPDAGIAADLVPTRPVVLRPVETAADLGVDEGIDSAGGRGAHGHADPPGRRGQAIADDWRPGQATVAGPIKAAAGAVGRWIDAPGRPPRLPQGRIDDVGIAGLEGQVDSAGIGVLEQGSGICLPAVGGQEDAPLRVGTIRMAQ